MKILIESPVRQRMEEAYSVNEQDGFMHANRDETHRHALPPLVCRKMWMSSGSWGWNGIPPIHPSSMHPSPPPASSFSPQTGAQLSCDSTIRPPTQHTRASNTHKLFLPSHTCTFHALPPIAYIACFDAYTIAHVTCSHGISRSFVGGKPPTTTTDYCCRSVNEQLQRGGSVIHAGTWEQRQAHGRPGCTLFLHRWRPYRTVWLNTS